MGLSPESPKAEESLEEQKDEFQENPYVRGAALSPGTRALLPEPLGSSLGAAAGSGTGAPGRGAGGALGPAPAGAEAALGPPGAAGRAPPFLPAAAQGLGRADSGHGERLRLRLRLRRRRRGQARPGAHHGAGEGADRRGQRAGAPAADDGQVLSEVHREARRRPGQLRAEVHRHVHGPVHGLLEHSFASLQFSAAAGESQHVTPAGLRAERDHVGKGQRPVQVLRGESCCLPSPCHGRAIKPR